MKGPEEQAPSQENAQLNPENTGLLDALGEEEPVDRWGTWKLGITLSCAYALNYFWRYPIFMLPSEVLHKRVVTIFNKPLKLQACFSMAFTLGFGAAKIPAVHIMSSSFFFTHRVQCCIGLFILTMLTQGVGVYAFSATPALQVLAVFVSCFFSSWIYGGLITYIEGRRSTEVLLAVMAGFFIYAGNVSRGTASLVLNMGVEPQVMPLVIGLVACPLACGLIYLVSRMPGPSAADVASRSKRAAMTSEQRVQFCKRWWPGLLLMLVSYATMTGIRSFRDFYVQQIFAAAMHKTKDEVGSWVYFVADGPGAVLSVLALAMANRAQNHVQAMKALFVAQICAVLVALLSTMLFKLDVIGGLAWQMSLGAGIYVSYTLMQTPVFERLFAATKQEGTCAFLIFLSDFVGYMATISLLLYNSFGPLSDGDDDGNSNNQDVLDLYLNVLWGGGAMIVVTLCGCLFYFMAKLRSFAVHQNLEATVTDQLNTQLQ